jgi:translation initiation factor IF-2
MTEQQNEVPDGGDRKSLRLSRPGRLEIKKTVEAGQVRQSFPHGRTKTVQVEVKKKRTFAPGASGAMTEVVAGSEAAKAFEGALISGAEAIAHLTAGERATRLKALEEARRDDDLRRETEAEALLRGPGPVDERAALAGESAGPVPSEITSPPDVDAAAGRVARGEAKVEVEEEEEAPARRRPGKTTLAKPISIARRGEPRRRAGKITVTQALGDADDERTRSLASVRRAREKEKQRAQELRSEGQKVIRDVIVPESITVQDLANRMAVRGADVIKSLMKAGIMANINQALDPETAELVVIEFGHRVRRVSAADVEMGLAGDRDDPESLRPRPPVVTVMGHVDHGKTSLLDAMRQTDVAAHEAGGITQHIGAYQVTRPNGQRITFIDTPGHAAFSQMRARGANVTDIVVLVVAADDGIMPQTVEAIDHAKAAGVPIIVAINKVDKPDARPERVRQEMLQHGLVVEAMGGDILDVEVSAKTKQNIDKLEEIILLQAEVLDLKANPDRPAGGRVIEARLDRGRGVVATLLVQAGTLEVGDIVVCGKEWGRVRAMLDDRGASIGAVGPGTPAEIVGLQAIPQAGDDFVVVESENRAREITEFRRLRERETQAAAAVRGTLEQQFSKIAAGEAKEVAVVMKSDVQGSLEAIGNSLSRLGGEEVVVRVLHAGVGGINESDVTLARASGAIIIGFNVRANPQAREMARRDGVNIRYYSIIYNVVDDMKALLSGMLKPILREKFLGLAAIRDVFNITKVGRVAGCMVTEGQVKRGAKVRLLRDNVVIHEGSLRTLKRFKDEVRDVKEGYECGMAFENYQDIQPGDAIECFEMEQVARELVE